MNRPRLGRGDTVGVVATGFAVRPEPLAAGVCRLEQMGFRVRLGPHVREEDGYLAGDDHARAADLQAMLDDADVRAIWFARGGYGTARLLDRLQLARSARFPKLFIGYSDVTALFPALMRRGSHVCLYGPVVTDLGDPRAYHLDSLRRLLRGRPIALRFGRRQVLAAGRARGKLVGGNLTVLVHLLGTRFAPDLRGAILFLEDIGEEAYRVDRMLNQLRLAGALRSLAGVLLGRFDVPPTRRSHPGDRPLAALLEEIFAPLGVPVVVELPVGHIPGKRTLPLGGTAEIDTGAGRVRLAP